jgi:hypothetical protein
MDDEIVWKMQHCQMEASIRELYRNAIAECRVDRLKAINLSLQAIEREILEEANLYEEGERACKPVWPFLRTFMGHVAEAYSFFAFGLAWDAAAIRLRLKQR